MADSHGWASCNAVKQGKRKTNMAKPKQPSAKVGKMIEGDMVENTSKPGIYHPSAKDSAQTGTSRPAREVGQALKAGSIFVTALAALFLSLIALGFAGFSFWKNSQKDAIAPRSSADSALTKAIEKRFLKLEGKIVANEKNQQKAMAAFGERLDQRLIVEPLGNIDNMQAVATGIDQRFSSLEMAVKDLATTTKVKPVYEADEVANNGADSDLSITPDQASILIVSGLLADNMAGASLDRWIGLLQGLANKGVSIPDLAKLRLAATPTPKRSLYLIRTAHDLVPQMIEALSLSSDATGFLEKTRVKLGQLVQLREIGVGANGNEAALRAFEAALAIQDLDGAVRAAGQWSGIDVPFLKKWMVAAQSRQSLDQAVSALVTDRLASAIAGQL
ncbi:hypothetical protein N8500_00030 [Candidatus Puniceispirillum sp.]|nr:hypothetical protein [Candidatus Puniceispirillum sp.]